MTTYANIGGAEPSTLTFKVATIQIARGSTNEQQEILCLGDNNSSIGIARVLAAPMASTEYGLGVRIISGPSSAADCIIQSVINSGNSSVISTPARTSSAALTNFSQSSATGTLLASNANRSGVLVVCDASANLYIKYGTSASTSSYSVQVPPQAYWEMPRPVFTGQLDAAWASTGTGAARVTELT